MGTKAEECEERERGLSAFHSFFVLFLFLKTFFMFPYENLEVYKKAFLLNQKVYQLLKGNQNMPRYLRDQLGRACLSIQLNIAAS